MSGESVHRQLMREMHSPNGAFDPMPPSQIAFLMDASQPPEIRALGFVCWKTVHPTRRGKGFQRSAFMRDERGPLGIKHCADYFDWELSFASRVFARLTEQERIFRDDKGRIYLNGDVPEPVLKEEANKKRNELCTVNLPEDFSLYLQSVDKSQSAQWTADYIKVREYAQRIEREAIGLARARAAEIEQRFYAAVGFQREKKAGRPRENRSNAAVQLELTTLPDLSVQLTNGHRNGHSAHKPKPDVHTTENGSVHDDASLLGFQSSQSSQSEVERPHVENSVSELEKEAPTARPDSSPTPPTTPLKTPAQEQKEADADPVIATVEYQFGRKLAAHDPLRTKFPDLAQRFGIPKSSVCRWMAEKLEKKERQRYKIHNPGALYQFAVKDLPGWIAQHPREIAADESYEMRNGHEPDKFDPASYNAELRSLAAKKGM